MDKSTIFISHASEDNYFASWLKSKLELLGYKVWCDVEDLSTGSFWTEIDRVLREESVKVICVITKNYIERSKNSGTGVARELARVMVMLKNNPKLVIPIRIDDTSWDDFDITLIGFQGADFANNWADGLRKLVKYLEDDCTPKKNISADNKEIVDFWYKALKIRDNLLTKEERYYTNWFRVQLPEKIYIYDFELGFGKDFNVPPYVFKRENNLIITFCAPDEMKNYLDYKSVLEISTEKFFNEDIINYDNERSIKKPNNKLVEMLNKAAANHIKSSGMYVAKLSGNKEVFYSKQKGYISLKHLNKTHRFVCGKKKGYNWHFAFELNAFLHPIPAYSLAYHIVFTNDNNYLIGDKKLNHSMRRKVAVGWYNREWLEKMLAMISLISNTVEKTNILVPVSISEFINIDSIPLPLVSEVGYNEP